MFEERPLRADIAAVRDARAPDALVYDTERDFEVLPTSALTELTMVVDDVEPRGYDADWLPADHPRILDSLVGDDVVVGAPGDGSVAWTTQTDPPIVLVKPRIEGSPDDFVAFLVAEALVQVGLDLPEHFLGLFRDAYAEFAAATPTDPTTTYQLALAASDAYAGLHTREVFSAWDEAAETASLHDAWTDAGERLQPRLDGLGRAVASGDTSFTDAAELAAAGVKHGLDLPAPFDALDDPAYREHGARYAVAWAERVFS
ncbi:hypothetical protein J2752_002915 [Halarchaeum rubridurum]|uniref:Uncharacterized protein n=1 Tax=Halarchaeum rubridurum TaxID=489911 RepID=A0A830G4P9_9EURY|nr:hypothetical protein [Halarchaeum rubridurum]MBP1955984.1 hypothetical protein [Halarchaeum rubridurum]GGM76195.1 hypothetical protein GCM10009017_27610 [Halarchaeum rubridurum]